MNKLKDARIRKKYTQEKLAELSGISRQTIAAIENNKANVITNVTMKKLADAVGKSVGYIFFS